MNDDRHPNAKILDDYADANDDHEVLTCDGLDEAILGLGFRACKEPVVVYNREKCIDILEARMQPPDAQRGEDDMTAREEAEEFFEFNTIGAWVGERTPIFLVPLAELEANL